MNTDNAAVLTDELMRLAPFSFEASAVLGSHYKDSSRLNWDGIFLCIISMYPPQSPLYVTVPQDNIIFHTANAVSLRRKLDGHTLQERSFPGNVVIQSRNIQTQFHWADANWATNLHLFLSPPIIQTAVRSLSERDPELVTLRPDFNFRDSLLYQLGMTLQNEIQLDGLGGRVFAESMAHTLALHLVRQYSTLVAPRSLPQSGLTPAQLRRATDYMMQNLHQNISLTDIAAAVGLSPSHFARAFKESTGYAPHQYLIHQRIELAKDLLLHSTMTIAEVAQSVGFADQSHLNRHFKRILGVTPRLIRHQ